MSFKSISKKTIAILCASVMVATVFAGCSGKNSQESSASTGTAAQGEKAKEAPFNLSIIMNYFTPEPPPKDGEIEKIIENYTNTNLDMAWLPGASYDDKFNVLIASGDMPMMIVVKDNKNPTVVQAVQAGVFWEIGPYLKDYKNLSQINKVVQDSVAYDGKTFGLYRMRTLARYGFVYRKDWLDTLGLKVPGNTDELYNVMKAFTENDPDKNGKNDTMGVVERTTLMLHDGLTVWYGGPNNWEVDSAGKMTPAHMTQGYMDGMSFIRKLYNEKMMNGDFAVAQKQVSYDMVNNGSCGMYYGSMDDARYKHDVLYKTYPNAKIDVFSQIKGPKGDLRLRPTTGWNGMLFFNKKAVKTEADLKKALAFVDKLDDQKMQNLVLLGIEGKHYTVENGFAKPNANQEQFNKDLGFGAWDQLTVQYVESKTPEKYIEVEEHYRKMWTENVKYVVGDPCAPFISPTYSQNGAQLDKIITDARIKYIMGAIDEAGFKKEVDKWNQQGGAKIIKEFEDAYKKIKK